MNEWTNERMNEWTNERMNEWTNERTNERMNEWTNERTNTREHFHRIQNGFYVSRGIFFAGFLFAAIRAAFVPTYQPVKRLIFGTTRFYDRGTIGDDFAQMRQIRRRNGEGRLHPLDMSNGCNRPFPFPLWILRILVKSSPIVPRIKKRVLAIFTFYEFFNIFSK